MHAGDELRSTRHAARTTIVFGGLTGMTLFVYWGLFEFNPVTYGAVPIGASEARLFEPAAGSPILIVAATAFLLFRRREQLKRVLGQRALWVPAITLLAGCAAVQRWADFIRAPELLIPSLMLLLLGSGALLGGRKGLRLVAPPALFLGFAFPIPASMVNAIVWPLQLSTAASADWVLSAIGRAPERFGDVIYVGRQTFEVIETCSGMRTIEILIMTSALYAMLFYRRPFQVLLLLFLAPILGYFINLVRVLSIIFNPYSAWTSVHTAQGVIMLVIGVLLIVAADRLLEHREANLPPQAQQHPVETARSPISSRTTGLASMLVILGIGNWLLPTWQPESSSAYAYEPRALRLPLQLARSTPKGHKLDRGFLGSVGVTKWLHREYDFLDATVGVQILANDRLNGRSALVSEKTAVPGSGQSEVSHDRVQLTGGGYVNRHIYRSRDQRTLVYHWYEGTAGAAMENYRNAIVLDRGFARRNEWAVAMRLSTVVAPGVDGVVLADARLQGFAEVIRASLQRFRSN